MMHVYSKSPGKKKRVIDKNNDKKPQVTCQGQEVKCQLPADICNCFVKKCKIQWADTKELYLFSPLKNVFKNFSV